MMYKYLDKQIKAKICNDSADSRRQHGIKSGRILVEHAITMPSDCFDASHSKSVPAVVLSADPGRMLWQYQSLQGGRRARGGGGGGGVWGAGGQQGMLFGRFARCFMSCWRSAPSRTNGACTSRLLHHHTFLRLANALVEGHCIWVQGGLEHLQPAILGQQFLPVLKRHLRREHL